MISDRSRWIFWFFWGWINFGVLSGVIKVSIWKKSNLMQMYVSFEDVLIDSALFGLVSY